MGCWIDIAGEKKGEKIRVKVKDGEIVFPKDSKGKKVSVEGVVEEVKPEAGCDKEMKKDDTAKMECCSKEKEAKMDKKECAEKCKDAKMDKKECSEKCKDAKMDKKECTEKCKDGKAKMEMKECSAKEKEAKTDDCCAGAPKKVYQIKGLGAVIK